MSVYRALQPARFMPSLTGAAPFHLSGSSIKFSRLGQIWSVIQLLTLVSLIIYFNRERTVNKIAGIKSILPAVLTWLLRFISVYSALKDAFWQKNIIAVVQSLENYDMKTGYSKNANGKSENERVRFWSFAYTILMTSTAVGRYCAVMQYRLDIVSEMFYCQMDNSILMFAVLVTLLGFRFRHLNTMVEETRVTSVQGKDTSELFEPANPECIRVFYTSLVAIGQRLNDHYSYRLFLWSAQIMFGLLTRNYFLNTEKVSTLLMVAAIMRILSVLFGMLTFSMACQFATDQAHRITSVLLERNIRHTARIDRGRKELFSMSLYIALRPFQFSALGFFNVDLSLSYAIVTVTISYVVLCMQSHL